MRVYLIVLVLGSILSTTDAFSQTRSTPPPNAQAESQYELRPTLQAVRLFQIPVLDGVVMGDEAWRDVPLGTGFTQTTPDDGKLATQRTEIRVGFTDEMLYVSAVLYDSDPAGLVTADSRRDASMSDSDSFRFILDTFSDGQNGFVFGTNAAGAEYDAQFVASSGGGGFRARQRGGSGGGLNSNWDAAWDVAARITSVGWSAEFAIPFKTLRFPAGEEQVWGINFERTIRRNNETAFWAPLERQFNLTRVTHAGSLRGLEVPEVRNLKIMPYGLSSANHDFTALDPDTEFDGDFGVDLKYSITPSLTLDATYNTDFAQVEVDEQQVNLDRFSLFFPEKRSFFLENAGLFSVGERGEAELFFSRRIGIDPDGLSVPILGGARITGDIGGFKVGLLEMQTEKLHSSVAANNFAVARVLREFENRSAIGVLFTNRTRTGSLAESDDHNRVGAVDARWGIGEYGTISGWAAASDTPGLDDNSKAGQISGRYAVEKYTLSASYTEVAEDFNPEIGFLRRSDYQKVSTSIFTRFRPNRFGLHEIRPHSNFRGYWKRDGFQQTGFFHIDNHWEFRSGYEIHTGRNYTFEGVEEEFEIADGVTVQAAEYSNTEMVWVAQMPDSKPVRLRLNLTHGGFFGGDRLSFSPTLTARKGESLNTEFALGHNRIDLPGGDFVTNLVRARVSYSFTPRIFLQTLGQYNDQSEEWSMNIRFGWLQQANTGLFVVYNSINRLESLTMEREFPGEPIQKGLIIKYTYLFDVFE